MGFLVVGLSDVHVAWRNVPHSALVHGEWNLDGTSGGGDVLLWEITKFSSALFCICLLCSLSYCCMCDLCMSSASSLFIFYPLVIDDCELLDLNFIMIFLEHSSSNGEVLISWSVFSSKIGQRVVYHLLIMIIHQLLVVCLDLQNPFLDAKVCSEVCCWDLGIRIR